MRKMACVAIVGALVLGLIGRADAAPPGNDDFVDAIEFPSVNSFAAGDTTEATTELGEPVSPNCIAPGSIGKTVWYSFSPSESVAVSVNTYEGSNVDTVLVVYGPDGEIACNDDTGLEQKSRVAWTAEAGQTYWIQIGGLVTNGVASSGTFFVRLVRHVDRVAVVRGATWLISTEFGSYADPNATFTFGRAGDTFLAGSIRGDGVSTPVARRSNTWFLNEWFDGAAEKTVPFGRSTDRPLLGDWDGDGYVSLAVVRGNTWYIDLDDDLTADRVFAFGRSTDTPIVGDWVGDGVQTPAVVRRNVWYLNSGFDSSAELSFAYGRAGDVPLAGDWNGDGVETPGIVRGNLWYLNNGFDGVNDIPVFAYGRATDVKLAGDFDDASRPPPP